jgi:hypothetical protein
MRAFAGAMVLALAAAGCRTVPGADPGDGGYRGVERISILANGME